MKVPKDFADRVGALSSSTPREALENVLKAFLPRVPVQTRPAAPQAPEVRPADWVDDWVIAAPAASRAPNPFTRARRGTRTRSADTRRVHVKALRNPYRYGSKAYHTFRLFTAMDGETIAAIKQRAAEAADPKEYDLGYLHYASRDGYITLD